MLPVKDALLERMAQQYQAIHAQCRAVHELIVTHQRNLRIFYQRVEFDAGKRVRQEAALQHSQLETAKAIAGVLAAHSLLYQLASTIRTDQQRNVLEAMVHRSALEIKPLDDAWRAVQLEQTHFHQEQEQQASSSSSVWDLDQNPFDQLPVHASSNNTWPRGVRAPHVVRRYAAAAAATSSAAAIDSVATMAPQEQEQQQSRYSDQDHEAIGQIAKTTEEVHRLHMLMHARVDEQGVMVHHIVVNGEQIDGNVAHGTAQLEDAAKAAHNGCRCFGAVAIALLVLLLLQIIVFIWRQS